MMIGICKDPLARFSSSIKRHL